MKLGLFVHIGGRCFWCKIRQPGGYQPFDCVDKKDICSYQGLDRQPLLWDSPQLGLCQLQDQYLHARIRKEKNARVQTYHE